MPLRVVCASCSSSLKVKDELAGRAVKCPKCGEVVRVPTPDAPPPEPELEAVQAEPADPPRPAKGRRAEDEAEEAPARPAARARPRYEDDEEEDDRGSRQGAGKGERRPAKKSALPLILGIVGACLLLVCGGVGYGAYWLYSRGKQAVQQVGKNFEKQAEEAKKAQEKREAEKRAAEKNDRVTRANYDKLRPAMTRAEVEELLGPGQPLTSPELHDLFRPADRGSETTFRWAGPVALGRVVVWKNAGDRILVAFYPKASPTGRLQSKSYNPWSGAPAGSFLDDPAFVSKYGEVPSVTVGRLVQEYQADPGAADKRYNGQPLAVEGNLLAVEAQGEAGLVVRLEGPLSGPGKQRTTARCVVRPDSVGRAADHALGRTVRLIGTCAGWDGTAVRVNDCRFDRTGPGPDPAVVTNVAELIVQYRKDLTAADARYKGRQVDVRYAVVVAVGGKLVLRSGLNTPELRKVVPLPVEVSGGPGWGIRFDRLQPGDQVRVRGACAGLSGGAIRIEQGWLVSWPIP
jgi:predicted Zn finger-like uncharacterized protein